MYMSRLISRARLYSSKAALPSYESTMLPHDYAQYKHAIGSVKWWKLFNIFAVIPAIIGTGYFVWKREEEHHAHWHKPEFQAYPHLHKRRSIFPWGDGEKTLFHNDEVNPLPPSDE